MIRGTLEELKCASSNQEHFVIEPIPLIPYTVTPYSSFISPILLHKSTENYMLRYIYSRSVFHTDHEYVIIFILCPLF